MIKFRYKRKESSDNNGKINNDKKDNKLNKLSKNSKKDYNDCIRAVIVSELCNIILVNFNFFFFFLNY